MFLDDHTYLLKPVRHGRHTVVMARVTEQNEGRMKLPYIQGTQLNALSAEEMEEYAHYRIHLGDLSELQAVSELMQSDVHVYMATLHKLMLEEQYGKL